MLVMILLSSTVLNISLQSLLIFSLKMEHPNHYLMNYLIKNFQLMHKGGPSMKIGIGKSCQMVMYLDENGYRIQKNKIKHTVYTVCFLEEMSKQIG